MKKYSQLADLESLLLDIRDSNIRAYAKEAIDCYFAGAYRASIVSIWIAIVYDLYQKIRYLSEQYNDLAAQNCINDIEKIRNNPDKKQVSAWEREILKNAYEKIKMITETEFKHLNRIQEDRNSCAHPVLDSEGLLFQPSPELARIHIRTTIEILLSQSAIIGKPSIDALVRDVEGSYFPNQIEGVKIILKNRHLINSQKYIENIFLFTLKQILVLEATDDILIKKYILVFVSINEECPQILNKIDTNKITVLLDRINEEKFKYFYELLYLYKVKELWNNASVSLRENFKTYISKTSLLIDYEVILLFRFLGINEIENVVSEYNTLSTTSKKAFLQKATDLEIFNTSIGLIEKIIEINIDIFTKSGSFETGRSNVNNLIEPIKNYFTETLVCDLLNKSIENQKHEKFNQLLNCETNFIEIFNLTIYKYPITLEKWQWFIGQEHSPGNWHNLKTKVEQMISERGIERRSK